MVANSHVLFLFLGDERHFVYGPEDRDGLRTPDKLGDWDCLEKSVISILVTVSFTPLFLGLEHVCLDILGRGSFVGPRRGGGREIFEHVFRVEEFRVNVLRRQEVATNNENFGRYIPRTRN